MSVKLRVKRPDPILRQIASALNEYHGMHPLAEIEAYRQNSVSVRIRIINPEFRGKSRAEREDTVWTHLNTLPEEVVAEISLLLLLTEEESRRSLANADFDDPIPSRL